MMPSAHIEIFQPAAEKIAQLEAAADHALDLHRILQSLPERQSGKLALLSKILLNEIGIQLAQELVLAKEDAKNIDGY